jgi:uncharacterized protein
MRLTAENDILIPEILQNSKNIAVIGIKDDETEVAFKVPYYMHANGYKIFPVNPKHAGKKILDTMVNGKVTDINETVDIVNIFRKPEFLVEHAKEILQMDPLPKYVWFQLGIYNDEAAKMLEKKGIRVVQNRCIMVEHANL